MEYYAGAFGMKGYSRRKTSWIIMLLVAVGMAVLLAIMILYYVPV